ncbi:HNH endonuclease [Enemella evansiae]|uniref:HNH endonuclease n=1 Tax=Enemella evansiae TaxID=2016499 RepID=UPI0010D709C3|nr:HNH endonuclease [Enemella evansiae]TDO87627.1 HNH/ENDO VII superfamily nuclease [Enemella evansiae]
MGKGTALKGFVKPLVDPLLRTVDDAAGASAKQGAKKGGKEAAEQGAKKTAKKSAADPLAASRSAKEQRLTRFKPPDPKNAGHRNPNFREPQRAEDLDPRELARAQRRGRSMNGGQAPINSQYAGQRFPLEKDYPELAKQYPEGVRFSPEGYPQFGRYALHEVELPTPLAKTSGGDMAAANRLVEPGFKQPPGFTWHHVEGGPPVRMQLVPTQLHGAVRHTGGRSQNPHL